MEHEVRFLNWEDLGQNQKDKCTNIFGIRVFWFVPKTNFTLIRQTMPLSLF